MLSGRCEERRLLSETSEGPSLLALRLLVGAVEVMLVLLSQSQGLDGLRKTMLEVKVCLFLRYLIR